jgi:hypothetical protein
LAAFNGDVTHGALGLRSPVTELEANATPAGAMSAHQTQNVKLLCWG